MTQRQITDDIAQQMAVDYSRGLTLASIGGKYGFASSTVRENLVKRGIILRRLKNDAGMGPRHPAVRTKRTYASVHKPEATTHEVAPSTEVEILLHGEVIETLAPHKRPRAALDEAERHVRHMASFGTTAWPRAVYVARCKTFKEERRVVDCREVGVAA